MTHKAVLSKSTHIASPTGNDHLDLQPDKTRQEQCASDFQGSGPGMRGKRMKARSMLGQMVSWQMVANGGLSFWNSITHLLLVASKQKGASLRLRCLSCLTNLFLAVAVMQLPSFSYSQHHCCPLVNHKLTKNITCRQNVEVAGSKKFIVFDVSKMYLLHYKLRIATLVGYVFIYDMFVPAPQRAIHRFLLCQQQWVCPIKLSVKYLLNSDPLMLDFQVVPVLNARLKKCWTNRFANRPNNKKDRFRKASCANSFCSTTNALSRSYVSCSVSHPPALPVKTTSTHLAYSGGPRRLPPPWWGARPP